VIGYTIEDGRDPTGPFRLITTLLDHREAPAAELAAAYTQRWEIETAFDELKTHQRGPRAVLRSKSPDLVTQEIWGHLCCHYAIRSLMFDAAEHAGHDPDRVSFVAALRISRRSIAQQGASPLTPATPSRGSGATPSANSSAGSSRGDDTGPTPASSNASTPGGTSNEPDTDTGRNPTDHPTKPSSSN